MSSRAVGTVDLSLAHGEESPRPGPDRASVGPALKSGAAFSMLACGLAWLVALPLWLSSDGLNDPLAWLWMTLMMFTPSISALIVARWLDPERPRLRDMGIGLGRSGWWTYWLVAWIAFAAYPYAALFVGDALGVFKLDLQNLSGLRVLLEAQGASLEGSSIHSIAALLILQSCLLGPVLSALPVLGEELGWRGYLLPKLTPLGVWPAAIVSGLIWGVWHAPVLLLGYNYPQHPFLSVPLMVGFCTVLSPILAWTRFASASVWPAVLAHAAMNSNAGAGAILVTAGTSYDTAHATLLGWSGWIVPLLFVVGLVALGRLPAPFRRVPSG